MVVALLSPSLLALVIEHLALNMTQKEEVSDRNEAKEKWYANDLQLHLSNVKNLFQKVKESIYDFSKISGYKMNIEMDFKSFQKGKKDEIFEVAI